MPYAKSIQQLTVPDYFFRQKNSQNWSVRLVPPEHVKRAGVTQEFRKSTGQADLRRAKPIGLTLISDKLREWDAIARTVSGVPTAPVILNQDFVTEVCAARLYSWSFSDEEDRDEGLDETELAAIEEFTALTESAMRQVIARGPGSPEWLSTVESALEWCQLLGHEVDVKDPLFTKFVRAFANVELKAQILISQRNGGAIAIHPEPPNRNRLSSVVEPFRQHKAHSVTPAYLSTMLNAWRLFTEHCGDISLDSVNQSHIYDFMKARIQAPKKPWSPERAKVFGNRTLREIFSLARAEGLMNGLNPVDQLEVFPSLSKEEEASRNQPRYPFTSPQLNEIFASAWYDPLEKKKIRGKMRKDLGARYWIPLIGLCHGNRVREALQLVASDFITHKGVPTISFRVEIDELDSDGNFEPLGMNSDENPAKKIKRRFKNEWGARLVPIHPILIALGIEEFIEGRRKVDGLNAMLFPSSEPRPGGISPKLGRSYEQAFLRWTRDKLKFGNGFGSHSFRHQLEDRLREAQAISGAWPPGLGQQYSGRKKAREEDRRVLLEQGSEADYGVGYSPSSMLPYIRKIDFSDVRVPKPYECWLNEQ